MQWLAALIAEIVSTVAIELTRGIITGEIRRPPQKAVEAERDDDVTKRANDALADFDRSGR